MTSLEKVAMAICDSMEADDFGALPANSIYRAAYIQQAKAALNALLNPDEGTIEALMRPFRFLPSEGQIENRALASFNAAINHIIKEGEG